jgi:hypothetical protein
MKLSRCNLTPGLSPPGLRLLAGLVVLALALAACTPVVLTPDEQGETLIEEVNRLISL